MGEIIEPHKAVLAQASEDAMVIDTTGGRMHVRWDATAQATPHGQIAFFAAFLARGAPVNSATRRSLPICGCTKWAGQDEARHR